MRAFLILLLTVCASPAFCLDASSDEAPDGSAEKSSGLRIARSREGLFPPDIMGRDFSGMSNSSSSQAHYGRSFSTYRVSRGDITLTAVAAPLLAAPKSFPPFPNSIDLNVELLKPSAAPLTYSFKWKEIVYRDIDGTYASSALPVATGDATANDTIKADSIHRRALSAQKILKEGEVKGAFELYSEIVRPAYSHLTAADEIELSKCHKALGDILYKYGWLALEADRVETGRRRLLSAWLEYKRALFLDPGDKQSLSQLVVLSKYATEQEPVFDNWLAYGSALYLSGEKAMARECYRRCKRLDASASVLKRLPSGVK